MPRHSPYALISLTLELCSIIKFLLIVVFPTIIFIVVFLICITFNIASLFNFQAAAWKLSFPMGTSGLEPPTSRLSGVRSNHLSYAPKRVMFLPVACQSFLSVLVPWWRWGGSNSWPPACKAGALPAELHPRLRDSYALLKIPCGILKIEQPAVSTTCWPEIFLWSFLNFASP